MQNLLPLCRWAHLPLSTSLPNMSMFRVSPVDLCMADLYAYPTYGNWVSHSFWFLCGSINNDTILRKETTISFDHAIWLWIISTRPGWIIPGDTMSHEILDLWNWSPGQNATQGAYDTYKQTHQQTLWLPLQRSDQGLEWPQSTNNHQLLGYTYYHFLLQARGLECRVRLFLVAHQPDTVVKELISSWDGPYVLHNLSTGESRHEHPVAYVPNNTCPVTDLESSSALSDQQLLHYDTVLILVYAYREVT